MRQFRASVVCVARSAPFPGVHMQRMGAPEPSSRASLRHLGLRFRAVRSCFIPEPKYRLEAPRSRAFPRTRATFFHEQPGYQNIIKAYYQKEHSVIIEKAAFCASSFPEFLCRSAAEPGSDTARDRSGSESATLVIVPRDDAAP